MRAIVVANPKGGSGKTTVATNLAAGLAAANERVYLWDIDRQKSALTWLSIRPAHLPRVARLDGGDPKDRDPGDDSWVVIDTPAGLHGKNLEYALRLAEKVLIPVQPSVFDMAATRDFLDTLLAEKAVRRHKVSIGVVGVRVDPRTRASATLEAFLQQYHLPILTFLRDTVIYTNAAFLGQSVFDLPAYLTERDRQQWSPVLDWARNGG
ncbi:AAA family ATPase [Pelomicrobium methylotrophicum]|uniref:AAA family ATPase n=1 Tax=Pelomicrobium methylotrophicum TaxID=2602750 RepID=A0A5C7ER71_9PROT|nr:AAA family ATPase [Pelomicrobium methylotrophicum]TXF11098.1 AAA family ATPase [Pelomicrobium methylotrophicum]